MSTFIFLSSLNLILFDFRHNFINIKYLVNYIIPISSISRISPNTPLVGLRSVYLAHNLIPSTFSRALLDFSSPNIAIAYANCPQYLKYKQAYIPLFLKIIVILILLIFIYMTFEKWRNESVQSYTRKIIFWYFLLVFSGISIYTYLFQGEMAEYYLFSCFAYFFIIVGSIFQKIYSRLSKKLVVLTVVFYIVFNIYKIFNSYNPYGYKNKMYALNYVFTKIGNKSFTLSSFQTCWYTGGYRYLLNINKNDPVSSYMDEYLNEYYTINRTSADYDITILTPELVGKNPPGYEKFKKITENRSQQKAVFGSIEVFISKLK